MALMKFREPNQVKWQGVRPGHNGEQIFAGNVVSNGAAIVYTVPAGKVLYVTGWSTAAKAGAVGDIVVFGVRDAGDVGLYSFMGFGFATAGQIALASSLFYPIEIPALYDVYIYTDTATGQIWATVFGWVE